MTSISFVTVIKNRTNLQVQHNDKQIELRLFENNIKSLISIIKPSDQWEFIIIDYESTDVDMEKFINTFLKIDNLQFKVFTVKGVFDKGSGLNYGSSLVSNQIVFFLDADMVIKTRDLFDDIEKYVVIEKKVLFPICWSYSNPEHTEGWKRDSGKGNVIQNKETIIPYMKNKEWGGEDDKNFDHFLKSGIVYRTYYGEQFIHQWHPEKLKHIYYTDTT